MKFTFAEMEITYESLNFNSQLRNVKSGLIALIK